MGNQRDDHHFSPFSEGVNLKLIEAFEAREFMPLPPESVVVACGVYGLFYFGNFKGYKSLSLKEAAPIYIGKAVTPGGRKGGGNTSKAKANYIAKRLKEHAATISSSKTLSLDDFKCRWLSIDPHFVGAAESILIDHYKPIWNRLIPGFGIHTPGKGRLKQACSDWDTLHPGRRFASTLPPGNDIDSILERIKKFLKEL